MGHDVGNLNSEVYPIYPMCSSHSVQYFVPKFHVILADFFSKIKYLYLCIMLILTCNRKNDFFFFFAEVIKMIYNAWSCP